MAETAAAGAAAASRDEGLVTVRLKKSELKALMRLIAESDDLLENLWQARLRRPASPPPPGARPRKAV
jgi:hypothetical protein